jgi:hypothetical protein
MALRTIKAGLLINKGMNMKSIFTLVLTVAAFSSAAFASAPTQCLGKPTAWKKNVLQALSDANISGATMANITQTGFDAHDPTYDVAVGGETIHVTCDDSGDDDCQCSVETK